MRPLVFLATSVIAAAPASADVAITERGGQWSEASITVPAPPSEVYAIATDYAHWQQVFSDIQSVRVLGGSRDSARVELESHALGHRVVVQFDNVPDRAIRFVGVEGPRGGKARGEYILEPIDGGTHTRVTARLYIDVVGVAGVFVRDRKLREMRQNKLRADLGDLENWASARRSD
jgi:uncharacterized membrane protein